MKNVCIFFLFLAISTHAQEDNRDWVVQVHLKNNSKLVGVARDGNFVEQRLFGQYRVLRNQNRKVARELAKNKKRKFSSGRSNIGMRLWYIRNSNGNIFIPYKNIAEIVLVKKGYDKHLLKKKQREVFQNHKKRKEQQVKLEKTQQVKRKKQKFLEKENEKKELEAKEQKKLKLTKEEKKLLEEYPPEDGWNQEKRNSFHKRLNRARNNFSRNGQGFIQKNRFGSVSKKQRVFHKNFDAWVVAVDKDKKLKKAKEKAQKEKSQKEKSQKEKSQKDKSQKENKTKPKKSKVKRKKKVKKEIISENKEITILNSNKSTKLKLQAIKKLTKIKAKKAIPSLIFIANSSKEDLNVRMNAIKSLGKIFSDEEDVLKVFKKKLLIGKRKSLRMATIESLLSIEEDLSPIQKAIRIATTDNVAEIRYKAILVIKKQFLNNSESTLVARLRDNNLKVKVAALSTLIYFNQEKEDKGIKEIKKLVRYKKILEDGKKSEDEEIQNLSQKYLPVLK